MILVAAALEKRRRSALNGGRMRTLHAGPKSKGSSWRSGIRCESSREQAAATLVSFVAQHLYGMEIRSVW